MLFDDLKATLDFMIGQTTENILKRRRTCGQDFSFAPDLKALALTEKENLMIVTDHVLNENHEDSKTVTESDGGPENKASPSIVKHE